MRCEWACGGWCVGYGVVRGVKVRQRVQLVYEWMYLFLVVDGRRGKLLWTWTDSMKSERIAAAVNGLKHQTDVGALVWDGARGHRSELVESVGVPTIVQPPYSPELNPAERVFEEVFFQHTLWPHPSEMVLCSGISHGRGGYVNRCVNDIRRRPSQPLIQWRFHPHTVHRGRRLRSTQGPSDA